MRIVIAIDSFKGSLTSYEAGNSIADGIRSAMPDANITIRPLADGGEGTVAALTAGNNGIIKNITVTGPVGRSVKSMYLPALPQLQRNTEYLLLHSADAPQMMPVYATITESTHFSQYLPA